VIHKSKGVQVEDVEGLIGELKNHAPVPVVKSKSVVKEVEKKLILDSLQANGGNQRKTAKELGMAKSTLHDKIKKYLQHQD